MREILRKPEGGTRLSILTHETNIHIGFRGVYGICRVPQLVAAGCCGLCTFCCALSAALHNFVPADCGLNARAVRRHIKSGQSSLQNASRVELLI